jgi:PadR family transcriptional regulator PadR
MRGAGPTAILQLLSNGEKYGYELVQLLDRRTEGVLAMGQSTLYPLLYNLQSKGVIASRTEKADNGRARRYYRITDAGRKRLARDLAQYETLSTAIGRLGLAGA